MNHSLPMKVMAGVGALFGLALLVAPNELTRMYKGEPMNGPGTYNSMLCGAFLLGIAVMNWIGSNATSREAKPVITGTFVAMTLGLVAALIRQLTAATVPPLAWINVGIFLGLALAFGYLQFVRTPAAGALHGSGAEERAPQA